MDERRLRRYERIYVQLQGLIEGKSPDLVAAMATICAVLHAKMPHHFWTGFYFAQDGGLLRVGPYQGPVACQILEDAGVCVHAMSTGAPVFASNVDEFPGHIACDSRSRSEIAIPVTRGHEVVAVFDVDSHEVDQFGHQDVAPLKRILSLLDPFL